MKLSIIIPSWKDPRLIKTIGSLLETSRLGPKMEIIAVLDGYVPSFSLPQDPRVRYAFLGANRGMREAINAGVGLARGEFIMRSDEHCMFADGFDKSMVDACPPDAIMTAVRFFLDPYKWEVMEKPPPVYYEKLAIRDGLKFEGQRWHTRTRQRRHLEVDETMAMQGSVWVMPRKLWTDVIGALQTEGYGPLYQDSHEMVFKVWQAGGRLLLNKRTWFAHKHYRFTRTHSYGTADATPGWQYSLSVWREYYEQEIVPRWFDGTA